MEESGQLHTLAALLQGKSPWYPLDRRWVGLRIGPDVVAKKKSLPLLETELWLFSLKSSHFID
jgi:hypothetical protein